MSRFRIATPPRPAAFLSVALLFSMFGPEAATALKVTVVDMIPFALSDETGHQSEPNLAVDPANPLLMAASAFIKNPKKPNNASIFLSIDGGKTWTLQPILPGSATLCTTSFCDVTLRFGGTSDKLYVASLIAKPQGMTDFVMTYSVNRFDNVFVANPSSVEVEKRSGVVPDVPDQPYVQATTVLGGEGTDLDRVFVGVNDMLPAQGTQTATVDVNLNAGAAVPPATLNQRVEKDVPPDPPGRDGAAVRAAFHSSGVVYAAFYRPISETEANLVVVRDNQWGASNPPFAVLKTGGIAGTIVAGPVPYAGGDTEVKLNGQRVGRSQISIAVDPNDEQSVWLAWGDEADGTKLTLHLRHSKDGGTSWGDADLRKIPFATNPAVAVNSVGTVGFLYQAVDNSGFWRTKVEIAGDEFAVSPPQSVFLSMADSTTVGFGANFIGDYDHLMAVGKDFYGVFSAANDPQSAFFPDVDDLIFQREHDATGMLSDGAPVLASIDPFFFHIETVTPDNDFFVRDWTEAPGKDPGLEPSTHSIFYQTSDVWNRPTNVSGNPVASAAPPHVDPQPGQNFAFVRVGREAQAAGGAPDVDVTPHFYYADFGAAMPYKDLGVAAPLPITFAPNEKEWTLPDGQGYEWTMPDMHSTHVCLGVELEAPGDPFSQPSLKNHVPGWPTLDTAVLYDNNKAQRNVIYPEMFMSTKAHYYALVRNAAAATRNVCLRLDSGVSVTSRYASIRIDACGLLTTSYRPGSTVCLSGMTAGEVRALQVTVDVPQSAQGADLALAFTEVTQPGPAGKPRDGFAISPVATSVDAAAAANLKFQVAVFGRLAALYNDSTAQFWTGKTRDLLASGFTLSQYVAFLQQVRPYLNRLTGLVPRSTSTCAPSPSGDLDRLLGAIQGADPQLITPAHNDYLQTLDIAITLSQIAVNGPGA